MKTKRSLHSEEGFARRALVVIVAIASGALVTLPALALTTPVIKLGLHDATHDNISKATVLVGTVAHAKTTVTGASGPVTGTVDFTRYNSLNCSGTAVSQQNDVPIFRGVAESAGFTTTRGNWSWRVHYNGDANYAEMDGPCQFLRARSRILQVRTEIHDRNHNDITFTMVQAGTFVHDKAIVTVVNGPPPTGTVTFRQYNNGTCSEPAATVEENVPLVNGMAESQEFQPAPGMISYRVTYNPDAVYTPHSGICEKLTVLPPAPFRMTGGGSVFTAAGERVTHGFALRCDFTQSPQRLEVNWDGNRFHLLDLDAAFCSDSPTINPNPPDAQFDTYVGEGTGRYNGIAGASATWTFTDAGEPGTADTMTIEIKDANGMTVLVASGNLNKGNHQAHKNP